MNTATSIGATWKNIPLRADYAHDLDAMANAVDAETKLIYICNPNNPTGTLTPIDKIIPFCKTVARKAPVFIDEAYIELLEKPEAQSAVGLIKEGHDVIISRTFSKVHGMAGLRIGYMVASAERVKMIQNIVRTEMGISVTSLEGALASLKDIEFQEYTRENNIKNRNYVFAELEKAGMNPIPSYTSFVIPDTNICKRHDGKDVRKTRRYQWLPNTGEALRAGKHRHHGRTQAICKNASGNCKLTDDAKAASWR